MCEIGIYKQDKLFYSKKAPYFPAVIFKEYPFKNTRVDKKNEIYASLRQLFKLLKLDMENFDTQKWNPFNSFISTGDTVLLKPNLVKEIDEYGRVNSGLTTHGSLIRAIIDYTYIALKGNGRIIVADGPINSADFDKIARYAGLYEIKKFYKDMVNFNIEIYDLRQERVIEKKGKIIRRIKLEGDPRGYTSVDLGGISKFKEGDLDYKVFKGSECRDDIMFAHHNVDKNEYLISNTLLKADVVINIPKLKTHKKAGVTLSLKNMVGITGDRNWLPHFSGIISDKVTLSPQKKNIVALNIEILSENSRDFVNRYFSGAMRLLKNRLRKQPSGISEHDMQGGNWHGNDIMWRTILDLAFIVTYADRNGIIRDNPQRKNFIIIDGIVGGEGNGPTNPDPKPCGVLLGGFDGCCIDIAASRFMGFDPIKIPKFRNILNNGLYKRYCNIDKIHCVSNITDWSKKLSDLKGRCLDFKPYVGWKDYAEIRNEA
nr:DUF362 domain-containing protein [Candidatus Omnitrophota bacterium]